MLYTYILYMGVSAKGAREQSEQSQGNDAQAEDLSPAPTA